MSIRKGIIALSLVGVFAGIASAQTTPGTKALIEDAKEEASFEQQIQDFKPANLRITALTELEWDSNVWKTDEWGQGNWNDEYSKEDIKSKNLLVLDYKINTEEDHAAGLSYLWKGDFYRNNYNKDFVMHKFGGFYQYDMDPDPLSVRADVSYTPIWIGGERFMSNKDADLLIRVDYSEFIEGFSHLMQRGDLNMRFTYNQYNPTTNNIQNETGLDRELYYKHTLIFLKSGFPETSKFLRSIDIGTGVTHTHPRNEGSRYREATFRPRFNFVGLPWNMRGMFEWVHRDRQYRYNSVNSKGDHRKDRRDELKFGVRKPLNNYLNLTVDYKRGWRSSNDNSKTYNQHVATIGVMAFF